MISIHNVKKYPYKINTKIYKIFDRISNRNNDYSASWRYRRSWDTWNTLGSSLLGQHDLKGFWDHWFFSVADDDVYSCSKPLFCKNISPKRNVIKKDVCDFIPMLLLLLLYYVDFLFVYRHWSSLWEISTSLRYENIALINVQTLPVCHIRNIQYYTQ